MRIPVIYLIIMFSFLFSNSSCKGQKKDKDLINRKPVVAGQFYAGNPTELREDLKVLFLKAKPKEVSDVVAIISPHAGYVYSGEVAASSFNQIDPLKSYDRIFIIGSSHRAHFNGASIYNMGNYVTPLGEVEVDIDLADKLIQENKIFSFNETAHSQEHSLEVQLPFLQYVMKSEFRIVPIVIGSQTVEAAEQIARALKPFFNQNNLFVISSDFSHYPPYKDAVRVDGETADAVVTKSPGELMAVLEEHANERVSNLATSMCGWTSMLALLNMIKDMPDTEIIPIQYKNSGDVDFGDKNRVVGYWSMAVTKKSTSAVSGFNLTDKDKNDLLHIARATVAEYIKNNRLPEIDASDFSETLHTPTGAFVTLHKNGDLRGCIGNFRPDKPLYLVV
nr:AmmeMemoRadiSam system protein B [Bacteroidota bacterium]